MRMNSYESISGPEKWWFCGTSLSLGNSPAIAGHRSTLRFIIGHRLLLRVFGVVPGRQHQLPGSMEDEEKVHRFSGIEALKGLRSALQDGSVVTTVGSIWGTPWWMTSDDPQEHQWLDVVGCGWMAFDAFWPAPKTRKSGDRWKRNRTAAKLPTSGQNTGKRNTQRLRPDSTDTPWGVPVSFCRSVFVEFSLRDTLSWGSFFWVYRW